jgi:hypothetical protein
MLPPIGLSGIKGEIEDFGIATNRNLVGGTYDLNGSRQLSLGGGGVLGVSGNSIVSSATQQKKRDNNEAGFQMNVYTPDKY